MDNFQLYFELGLRHIISWSSTDHILFLISLILVFQLQAWRKLFLLVSLFTLAHTLSLFLSVYGIVSVDEVWVEKSILVTIIITALSNIVIHKTVLVHQTHYYFSFFFGLIHGLGFAHDFKMMIGRHDSKLFPVLEFALGIELAQILIAFISLLLIAGIYYFIKPSTDKLKWIISSAIIGYVLALL